MKQRGNGMRPPSSPAYKFGQVIVLDAEDDEIRLDLPGEEFGPSNDPIARLPSGSNEQSLDDSRSQK